MAKRKLLSTILLLTVTSRVQSQYFDYFPSYQGFQNFQPPTLLPIVQKDNQFGYHPSHPTNSNSRKNHRNNNERTSTTKKYDTFDSAINQDIPFSAFLDVPDRDNGRKFFVNNKYSTTTTAKPARRNNSSHKNNNFSSVNIQYNDGNTNNFNNNRNNNNDRNTNDRLNGHQNDQWNYNTKPISNDNNKNNNIFEDNYYTTGPLYNDLTTNNTKIIFDQTTKPTAYTENSFIYREPTNVRTTPPTYYQYTTRPPKTDNNHRYQNNDRTTKSWRTESTTSRPFYNRPGVRPVYDNGPPITNKPIRRTERPSSDGLIFPQDEEATKLISGPDVDQMSEVQKRRFNDLVERMCDKYKTLSQKQVQAITLLPSPDLVRVNVSCAASPSPLIVGGQTVTVGQYPHSAAVGWRAENGQGYSWKCGGSLISDQFVLTAAHCTFQDRENSVANGPPEVVQLGSSYLNGRNANIYRISTAIRHPKYKRPIAYHDIALLKLANKVTFTENIRPACIGSPPPAGTKMTATGWGRTEFNGHQSQELRGVSLPVWDIEECGRVLGTSKRLPNGPSEGSQMCAGDYDGGKDTCQGDSGGPIQYRDGCAWRVAGVTSLGVACGAPRTPALYATPNRYFVAAVAFT